MDLREVLSPGDPWSRPDASRSARLARAHTSGVRGIEAEICKPGQETKISTKDHETKIPQPVRIPRARIQMVERAFRGYY
jgi:hypothetical protein